MDENEKPSDILNRNREIIRHIAMLHHTRNPRVFGSVQRGADTDDSDLDLLVDPLPGTTLFDLGAIQIELEEALGISVDVLTPGDLPEKFRDQVLQEAVPV
jgi:predicted nucleotidyltransferase